MNVKNIDWVDINDLTVAIKLSGKTHKELLRRLHVIADDGIYAGVDAFILMWKTIPKYKWLSKVISTPVVYQIAIVIYEIIAMFLYLKNYSQLNEKK